MLLQSPAVDRLVEAFRRLPGIGKRSAERLALHLLSAPPEDAENLAQAVADARRNIRLCSECCDLTESDPCDVCANPTRDRALVCVVERPSGTMAIEKGGAYRGLYHVLHGAISPLEGVGPDQLTIDALLTRVATGVIKEVIIATNATAEGEVTAAYLSRLLADRRVAASRIAHGVPMGSGLEFADDVTLSHAIQGRTRF